MITLSEISASNTFSARWAEGSAPWALSLWLPLVAIGLCVALGMTHLQSSLEQQRWLGLLERVDRYSQAAPDADMRHVVVGMRLLLPELERIDSEPAHAMRGKVDTLENWLQTQTSPHTISAELWSQLAGVRGQMLGLVLGEVANNARREMWLAVLLSLLGVVALSISLVTRSNKPSSGGLLAGAAEALFHSMPVAAVLTDSEDHIVTVNEAYERMTGYSQKDVRGQDIAFNDAGQQEADFYIAMRERLRHTGNWSGDFWLRNKAGEAFGDKVMRIKLGDAEHDGGYLTVWQDVFGSDDTKRLMLWQAHHDTLTKLPYRNMFLESMTVVLLLDSVQVCAVLRFDLDRFKILYDSVGSAQG
mgnify:FL=1